MMRNPLYQDNANNNVREWSAIEDNEDINNLYTNSQKNNPHLRYLVRESGTEPLLRLLVEGKDKMEVKKAMNNLSNNIKEIINVWFSFTIWI